MKPYKETQRFDQWWLRLLLAGVFIVSMLPLYMMYHEDGFEQDYNWVIFLTVGITFAVVFLFFILRLETKINAQGIHYRFFPLPEKQIPWQDIKECYVRQYSPLKEFGGWGIRFGFNGKAYNVKGNKGIQLVLKSSKKILIGTQNETEVKNVINSYKDNIK